MTHLTDLQCSMYADAALPDDEAGSVESHTQTCESCRAQLAVYVQEKQLIANVLITEDLDIVTPTEIPKFSRPISLRSFAMANLITGLAFWLAQFLWKTLLGEVAVDTFTRYTSIAIPDVPELLVRTARYLTQDGAIMFEALIGIVVICVVVFALAWAAMSYKKAGPTAIMCLLLVTGGSLLAPASSQALELRREEGLITVPADETIDDTLIVLGKTAVVDGNVTGDLVVLGERVVVNGTVGGNLIAMADSVTVTSQVDGTIISAGSSVELRDAAVGGDLWSAGSTVTINDETQIAGNSAIATENGFVAGSIKRGLYAFAEKFELNGEVGADFEAIVDHLSLLGDARVGGDLRFRTHDEDKLQRADGAIVDGDVEFLKPHIEVHAKNRYATTEFYVSQMLRLAAAFLAGMALLWLIPACRNVSLSGGLSGLATAGIGLVAIISLPIIMVLLAVTIVGIPLTVITLFCWVFALYFAKIVVASIVGRMLLSSSDKRDSFPVTLLAGLAALLIAVNIPVLGGIFSFIFTIVGVGLIVQVIHGYVSQLQMS